MCITEVIHALIKCNNTYAFMEAEYKDPESRTGGEGGISLLAFSGIVVRYPQRSQDKLLILLTLDYKKCRADARPFFMRRGGDSNPR